MRGNWLGLGFTRIKPGETNTLTGRTFDGPFALVLDAEDSSAITVESMTVEGVEVRLAPPKTLPWTKRGLTTWHGSVDRSGDVVVTVGNTGTELIHVAGGLIS